MLLKIKNWCFIPRRFVQALFIGHNKAKDNVRTVRPTFDYNERLSNRTAVENNISRRGLQNIISVTDLYEQWENFKLVDLKMRKLKKREWKCFKIITWKRRAPQLYENDLEEHAAKLRSIREEIKEFEGRYYDVEDRFNNIFLELPNVLLPQTSDETTIHLSHSEKVSGGHTFHLHYANSVEYVDETAYYLKNEAAKFDLLFPLNCVNYFRGHGFIEFSNPDFAKTVIVEGSAMSLESVFEIPESFNENCTNLIHLVGNGSWTSYLGFIAKIKAEGTSMPVDLVSTGKMYLPTRPNDLGLFNVVQSTNVQIFSAGTEDQISNKFETTLELICNIFRAIDCHFRVVYVPAKELHPSECFSARIEIFSPFLGKYIEIGRLSNYGDFISKRLQFRCNEPNYVPHLLGGTVCNVTKFLATILETYNGSIPDRFFGTDLSKQ